MRQQTNGTHWNKKECWRLVPFLETNCEVTPTSKVANTGEWSLVTMSSVQPEEEEQRSERAERASGGGGRAGGGGGTHRRSYRRCASPGRTSTGCGHTRRGRWSSSGGRNGEKMKMKTEVKKRRWRWRWGTHPSRLLLLPHVGVSGTALVAVRRREGDLLLRCEQRTHITTCSAGKEERHLLVDWIKYRERCRQGNSLTPLSEISRWDFTFPPKWRKLSVGA